VVLVAWCSLASGAFFVICKKTVGLRSDEDAEIAGLDMPEMGALAYPDFLEAQGSVFYATEGARPVDVTPVGAAGARMEVGS
jgi:Amt family ammonium transporter